MTVLKTWSRFTKVRNETEIKFRIQKVSIENYAEVLELFSKYFIPEEPFAKASGIFKNELALAENDEVLPKYIFEDPQIQVDVCYANDGVNEKIAGASIIHLSKKTDAKIDFKQLEFKTVENKKHFTLIAIIYRVYDVLEEQNVDVCFSGRGLVVVPQYRGLGLAEELLKVREYACKEYNVPLTYAWMTAFGSQKAASKLDWETVKELNYEDMGKEAEVTFENAPTCCKLMLKRVL